MTSDQRSSRAGADSGESAAGAEQDPPTSVDLETPPGWHELDLDMLAQEDTIRSRIAESLDGSMDRADEFATRLAALAGGTRAKGIFFAAMHAAPQPGNFDLTTVTLAVAPPREESHNPPGGRASDSPDAAAPSQAVSRSRTQPMPEPEAVTLPAGPAARVESADMLEISSLLPALPVFCVEYALGIPSSERALVMTFTSIAPTDLPAARERFADIASTLAFA